MLYAIKRGQMPKRKGKRVLCLSSIVLLTIPLASCNQGVSSGCPPLVSYPPAFQQQAARELPKAGQNVQTLVTDYGKLRDACRAMR